MGLTFGLVVVEDDDEERREGRGWVDGGGEGLEMCFVGGGGLGIVVVVVVFINVSIISFAGRGIIDASFLGRPRGFLIEGLTAG